MKNARAAYFVCTYTCWILSVSPKLMDELENKVIMK